MTSSPTNSSEILLPCKRDIFETFNAEYKSNRKMVRGKKNKNKKERGQNNDTPSSVLRMFFPEVICGLSGYSEARGYPPTKSGNTFTCP